MQVDISVSIPCPAWRTDLAEVGERAAHAARAALCFAAPNRRRHVEVSLRLSDDAEVRGLNRQHRGMDRPTNVLSFPADPDLGLVGAPPALLGDVILAHETVAGEASRQGKSLADHLCHLTVHGVLHLVGYDHVSDAEAKVMEAAERAILSELGIADPYAMIEPELQTAAGSDLGLQLIEKDR